MPKKNRPVGRPSRPPWDAALDAADTPDGRETLLAMAAQMCPMACPADRLRARDAAALLTAAGPADESMAATMDTLIGRAREDISVSLTMLAAGWETIDPRDLSTLDMAALDAIRALNCAVLLSAICGSPEAARRHLARHTDTSSPA